jgi:NAD(P)-dependent dehydrogenase (short-subunit alcohol dehydrogenase family)
MTTPTTILITGATDGLGLGLAHHFSSLGADLIIHGREEGKLERIASEIEKVGRSGRPRTVLADLSDLSQVHQMNDQILSFTSRLDAVNNAGIGAGDPNSADRQISADGYELRFAVNYLSGFLITTELLPLLARTQSARVINVSSRGHAAINFDDLMVEHPYDGVRAYGQSKMAQIMSTFEFARRVSPADVTFNCLHPATYMPTKMVFEYAGRSINSIADGVTATSRLVTSDDLSLVSGKYFNGLDKANANVQAYDEGACATLWNLSVEMTNSQ